MGSCDITCRWIPAFLSYLQWDFRQSHTSMDSDRQCISMGSCDIICQWIPAFLSYLRWDLWEIS
jgi:hypothetical protein